MHLKNEFQCIAIQLNIQLRLTYAEQWLNKDIWFQDKWTAIWSELKIKFYETGIAWKSR